MTAYPPSPDPYLSPSLSLSLFSSYTHVYPLSPLWWSLPWDRRAGRTWSTRAKLSAKLRKIVSDTSSYPPLVLSLVQAAALPTDRQRWYGQAGRRGASRVKGRRPMERGSAPGNVQYPVRSSLIYGRRGDLAPCLRYNTYVTDTREIPLGLGISFVLYTPYCENDVRVAFARLVRN